MVDLGEGHRGSEPPSGVYAINNVSEVRGLCQESIPSTTSPVGEVGDLVWVRDDYTGQTDILYALLGSPDFEISLSEASCYRTQGGSRVFVEAGFDSN